MIKKLREFIALRKAESMWYSPEDPTPREQCPCCDYISLPERGNYLICAICYWEDDGQDLDQIDQHSGPNHGITLRQGRQNFRDFGACEKEMLPHVIKVKKRDKYEYRPREDKSHNQNMDPIVTTPGDEVEAQSTQGHV